MTPPSNAPLLEVRNLRKYFPIQKGFLKKTIGNVRAVDDVSFYVEEGETLGLVGESGCGKTTASRCVVRAIAPSSGQMLFRTGEGQVVDLAKLDRAALRPLRPQMQMIFQDPYGSLNPRMNLLDIVGEPLLVNGLVNRKQRTDQVAELLQLVGMRPEYMQRFPHAFSGGQRQRIGIARALSVHPRLVVADEPVSALDVSVQAQILNLLLDLQKRLNLTYIFVAHNLGVVKHICDRVAVMYVGKLVEMANTGELFHQPRHPYTAALMAAVPVADPRVQSGCRAEGGPQPRESAVRLLLPPALRLCGGGLPLTTARLPKNQPGAFRRLPSRGRDRAARDKPRMIWSGLFRKQSSTWSVFR
jgi:peptide/nickel transport system ATP-binding protein